MKAKATSGKGSIALALCLMGICWATLGIARAQEPDARYSEALRQVIVTPKAVLQPLPAQVICGPGYNNVMAAPNKKCAFIFHEIVRTVTGARTTGKRRSPPPDVFRDSNLLLWVTGNRRTIPIWHGRTRAYIGGSSIDYVHWIPGTDTAIVKIRTLRVARTAAERRESRMSSFDSDKKAWVDYVGTSTFLRVNTLTGATETLGTTRDALGQTFAADSTPSLLLTFNKGKTISRVGTRGPISPPLRFHPDWDYRKTPPTGILWDYNVGDRLYGHAYRHIPRRETVRYQIVLNLQTGHIQKIDSEDVPLPPRQTRYPEAKLPYRIVPTDDSLTHRDSAALVQSLWVEPALPGGSGRALISADTDLEFGFTNATLTTAVIYQRQGTLFVTPFATLSPAPFLARREKQFKADTLKRAEWIGRRAEEYVERWDVGYPKGHGALPPPQDFLSVFQKIYGSYLALRNPATGKPGFTPAYTDTNITRLPYTERRTVPLGYLAGPNGRAIIYYGGNAKWESTP